MEKKKVVISLEDDEEDEDEEASIEWEVGDQTNLRGLARVGWLQMPVSLNLSASRIRFSGTHPSDSIH